MVKKVCGILSNLFLAMLLLLAAAILAPMLFGYQEMAVLTGSMEPSIPVGSLVYIKPVEAALLEPGDVCTYLLPEGGAYVTHRVVSVDAGAGTLVTQGDANDTPDGEVAFSQVLGEAQFHLPWLGYLSIYAHTSTGILLLCAALVIILLLNFIPAILDAAAQEKQQEAGEGQRPAGKKNK